MKYTQFLIALACFTISYNLPCPTLEEKTVQIKTIIREALCNNRNFNEAIVSLNQIDNQLSIDQICKYLEINNKPRMEACMIGFFSLYFKLLENNNNIMFKIKSLARAFDITGDYMRDQTEYDNFADYHKSSKELLLTLIPQATVEQGFDMWRYVRPIAEKFNDQDLIALSENPFSPTITNNSMDISVYDINDQDLPEQIAVTPFTPTEINHFTR